MNKTTKTELEKNTDKLSENIDKELDEILKMFERAVKSKNPLINDVFSSMYNIKAINKRHPELKPSNAIEKKLFDEIKKRSDIIEQKTMNIYKKLKLSTKSMVI